ncbi:cyanate hydratase [Parasynechococcus sp.]|uniref:cyanate hydratase n=1 Tax=Parasynechococcus sp. TaxID=3101203 RepID=UPI003703AE6D
MSQFFQSITSLLASQRIGSSNTTSLVLERLYYADGRHHPEHPRHGSFEGLSNLIAG